MIRNSQNPILIIKAPRVARPLSIEWPLLESEISLSDVGLDGLESRERARGGPKYCQILSESACGFGV